MSKWHNPFRLQDFNLQDSLLWYSYKVRSDLDLMEALSELGGQYLGCFCPINMILAKFRPEIRKFCLSYPIRTWNDGLFPRTSRIVSQKMLI